MESPSCENGHTRFHKKHSARQHTAVPHTHWAISASTRALPFLTLPEPRLLSMRVCCACVTRRAMSQKRGRTCSQEEQLRHTSCMASSRSDGSDIRVSVFGGRVTKSRPSLRNSSAGVRRVRCPGPAGALELAGGHSSRTQGGGYAQRFLLDVRLLGPRASPDSVGSPNSSPTSAKSPAAAGAGDRRDTPRVPAASRSPRHVNALHTQRSDMRGGTAHQDTRSLRRQA